MKAFLLGIAIMLAVSVGAALIFDRGFDLSSTTVFQSDNGSVRLD